MILSSAERIADLRARGLWPDLTFDELLRQNIDRVPEREAVVDPPNRSTVIGGSPRRVSWRELGHAVDALAGQLEHCGLKKDDVVVIQLANSWELLACYFACFRVGIVVSPVPAQYREHELSYIIQKTSAKALVTNTRIGSFDHGLMAQRLRETQPTLDSILLLDKDGAIPSGAIDLSALLSPQGAAESTKREGARAPICADDVVTILWTSGSEGRPKGIPRSHAQWLVSLDFIAQAFHLPDGARLLNGRPLVNHGALLGTLLPWLSRAGTIVLHHPFTLDVFVQQLRTERIDFTSIAPAILVSLLNDPSQLDGVDFSRLRAIASGSAPLPPAVVVEFERKFGVKLINLYGSTEGASLGSAPEDVPEPQLRATLFPRLGVPGFEWTYPSGRVQETVLVDLATESVITEEGKPGELRVRGPIVFEGYFNDPEMTRAAFDANGFYRTGDLFELSGDRLQYYRYVGRSKDVIVRGGFNISAAEVENLVASYPGVKEVAVIGIPDPRLGERVCAVVAMRDGHDTPTLDEIIRFLRNELAVSNLKLPEKLIVVDALPRNANTKVDKPSLRKMIRESGG